MDKIRGLLIIAVIGLVIYFAYDTYQKNHAGDEYNIALSEYKRDLERDALAGRVVNVSGEAGQYRYTVAFKGSEGQNVTFETKPMEAQLQLQDQLEVDAFSDTDFICVYGEEIVYATDEAVQKHKRGLLS